MLLALSPVIISLVEQGTDPVLEEVELCADEEPAAEEAAAALRVKYKPINTGDIDCALTG